MKRFKNLRIEVNDNQTIENIVCELERLKYKSHVFESNMLTYWIFTWKDGDFTNYGVPEVDSNNHALITLLELQNM